MMKASPRSDVDEQDGKEETAEYIDILRDKMNTGSGFEIRKTHSRILSILKNKKLQIISAVSGLKYIFRMILRELLISEPDVELSKITVMGDYMAAEIYKQICDHDQKTESIASPQMIRMMCMSMSKRVAWLFQEIEV